MEEITRVEHIWCKEDDRWVFIAYKGLEVVGLNYEQGVPYNEFLDGDYCEPDYGLTEFYKYMLVEFKLEANTMDTLEFINKVMWTYSYALMSVDMHNNKADLPWK